MGTLDFLKGVKDHVIDATTYDLLQRTYELQEENNRQLKEQVAFLKDKTDTLAKENSSLTDEVKKLSALVRDVDFVNSNGLAFRKGPDGKYDSEPYCPSCHSVLSKHQEHFSCQKCKYHIDKSEVGSHPAIIAKRLNSAPTRETPT